MFSKNGVRDLKFFMLLVIYDMFVVACLLAIYAICIVMLLPPHVVVAILC